jgi:hypothetical protein
MNPRMLRVARWQFACSASPGYMNIAQDTPQIPIAWRLFYASINFEGWQAVTSCVFG